MHFRIDKYSILLLYISLLLTIYVALMDISELWLIFQGIILQKVLANDFVKQHISLVHLKDFKQKINMI